MSWQEQHWEIAEGGETAGGEGELREDRPDGCVRSTFRGGLGRVKR